MPLTDSGTEDRILRTILFEAVVKKPESAVPLLLIGLGGTGAEVMRRVKWRAKWLGMEQLVRFVIIDSDREAKEEKGGFPGFDDHEFVYLGSRQARVVLNNTDLHSDVKERLNLGDPDVLHEMKNFAEAGHDGAGQVRRNGTLLFYGDYRLFQRRLHDAITHLNQRWVDLHRRDAGNIRSFNTILVSSVCGGTGAGILLDVACALASELQEHESHLMAILTLPEVYDHETKGKKDDRERMRANAYASLRELEYFRSGKARQDGVILSKHIPTPDKDMFSSVSLVSRVDASGQDLGRADAVYDTIGLYLGAFVGQTLQRRTLADLCNDNPQDLDPRLNRHRNVGTIAATALSLPLSKMLGFCAYQQALELTADHILGHVPDSHAIEKHVDQWLETNQLEERASKSSDLIIQRLQKATAFDPSQVTNRLYSSAGKVATYTKDSEFIRRYSAAVQRWPQTDRPQLVARLSEQLELLGQGGIAALQEHVDNVLRHEGLHPAVAFVKRLSHVLAAMAVELAAEVLVDNNEAKKFRMNADAAHKRLDTFFGRLGTDPARQDKIVDELRKAINLDGLAEIKRTAQRLITMLNRECGKQLSLLVGAVDSWEKVRSYLDERSAESRLKGGKIPYGESKAELSALTPKLAEHFYQLHRISREAFVAEITRLLGEDYVEWIRTKGAKKETYESIVLLAGRHYRNRILELDIAQLLEKEAKDENDDEKPIRTRLEAAVVACAPLWQARLVEAGVRFEDGLAVGRPAGADETFAEVIGVCSSKVSNDPRYQAQIQEVQTNDRMRIYAIRRIAGGLPYYLVGWDDYRQAYHSWQKKAGDNCVHTLSPSTAANLPPMEPIVGASEGERAFSLALAYGWIARRGRFYYFNLDKKDDGRFLVPISSHADCIAFENKKVRGELGALRKLIDNDIMKFESRPHSRGMPVLGGSRSGRNLALKEFAASPPAIARVLEAYDALRAKAGNDEVAKDLETYVELLKSSLRQSDEGFQQQQREIEILVQEIRSIKPRNRG